MFDEAKFLYDLDQKMIYQINAPLKQKTVRGNNMTKQLNMAMMDRPRIKNRYLKCPSREDFLELKKRLNASLKI